MQALDAAPIVAVATAAGRGAVGVVRVSGTGLEGIVRALCGRELKAREATYLGFRAGDGSVIDRGLAIRFAAPHSYTGEDVLELQAHGGPVVLQLLVARCLEAGRDIGLRPAAPGEFTQRAYLNDKLDLAQAEAVADLIDASTEAAARSASRSLAGAFSTEVEALRRRLVDLRVLVEATLDFPDEEVDVLEAADVRGRIAAAGDEVAVALAGARRGALLRDGLRVVLAGQPNVGKSSLLNALAGAELAIVTAHPGTTRDRLGETIQIEGVPVHVSDTAGLREATDEVERIGVARSWQAIEDADALLFLRDLTRTGDAAYEAEDARLAASLGALPGPRGRVVHVYNKRDAVDADAAARAAAGGIAVSARTGDGLEELRRALLGLAGGTAGHEGVTTARSRHVEALHRTAGHLDHALAHAGVGHTVLELVAEELRLAHDALGVITGATLADDLLGQIFGRFCIGK